MIEEFLSQDWTMEQPEVEKFPKAEIDALRRSMLDNHISMEFNEVSTNFRWNIPNAPKFLGPPNQPTTKKSKKRHLSSNISSIPNVKFQLHVHPVNQVGFKSN